MKQEHLEKIEDYLKSNITLENLKLYAKKEGIEDLDMQIEWVENFTLAVEADGLKDQLKEILPQQVQPKTKVRRLYTLKYISGIAAASALMLFAYFGLQDSSDNNLYTQFEYQDPGLPVQMSATENYALFDALTYFGEENYSTTIEKLSAIEGEKSDTISYYLGASYYYEKDFANARKYLTQEILTKSTFADKAEWLTVLSYIKSDQDNPAMDLIQKIKEKPNHKFYSEAIKLENTIKK